MAKLVVLYKTAADAAAFHAYYDATHIPLAKKIPGLVRYECSDGPIVGPTGPAPYQLVATLEFESMGALQQALGSSEGRASAADVPNFAQGGVDMLIFDTKEV
jgi:uncharacterized protein (TIGR02118 family)